MRAHAVVAVMLVLCASAAHADDDVQPSPAPDKNFIPLHNAQGQVASGSGLQSGAVPKFIPLKPRTAYVPLSHNLRPAMPVPSGTPLPAAASVPHPAKMQITSSTLPPTAAPAVSAEQPTPPPGAKATSKMTQEQANQLLSIYSTVK